MSIITYDHLPAIRQQFNDKKIVFCSGSFDLLHVGHVLFLEECKRLGDVLVAATGTDAAGRKLKGQSFPVLNEQIRLKMLDSIRPVDYTFIHKNSEGPRGEHNKFLQEIFEKLRPDVYVINEDAASIDHRQAIVDRYGIQMVILKRSCPPEFANISTTSIVKKIKSI